MRSLAPAALAVAVTAAIGIALFVAAGANPWLAFVRLFEGAFGERYDIAETLVRALPLAVVALGVAPALRSGIITVGSEGSVAIGALVATAVILAIGPAPSAVSLAAGMLAGALGGALWALIPAIMRAWGRVNEILTTLLMNYLAGFFLLFVLKTWLAIPEPVATPRSAPLPKSAMIPNLLEGTRLHWGILMVVVAALLLAWWVRSVRGLASDLFATHPPLAARLGVTEPVAIFSGMMLAGLSAGVVGWLQVAGLQGTLYPSVAGGLGFTGVLVALLGGLRPLGILAASLFFGALASGAEGMQAGTGVPASIARVFEGVILIAAALIVASRRRALKRLLAQRAAA